MKKTTQITGFLPELCAGLLILLFVYTGLNKLIDRQMFGQLLHMFPIIGPFAIIISWGVPVAELFIAMLLLSKGHRIKGYYLSIAILTIFTGYLIAMLLSGQKDLPCSCGGVIHYLSWQQHIFFNLAFILIAILGIRLQKKNIVRAQDRTTENLYNPK